MIYNPRWEWDESLSVGYLDLQDDRTSDIVHTDERRYLNATIHIDFDAAWNVVGIEVIP